MPNKHHNLAFFIGFAPIAIMFLAAPWGASSMEPTKAQYEELAQSAHKELQILDNDAKEFEKTRSLLTNGEIKESEESITREFLQKEFNSSYEKYEESLKYRQALRSRIDVLKRSLEPFDKKIIHIDLSEQKARVVSNDKIIKTYPVSSGAYETPTPQGEFQVHRKQELRISSQAVPYRMPYYIAFKQSGSHGLHALPYLGDNKESSLFWQEARSHIGIPVSHGCVRLLPEDIEELFGWAEIGTPIYIQS
jgi:lipoprotein-anchoring transpeptidase ErfK/SrfK